MINLFIEMIFDIVISIFSLLISIIIHELGHIIIGKILCFKLIYIEIFGYRIQRNKKNIIFIKKINAKVNMYPIGVKYIQIRSIVYYLGGILFTICIEFISIIFFSQIKFIVIFEVSLFGVILLSFIPMKGADIDKITKLINKKTQMEIFVYFYLMNGITPKNMPSIWFEFIKERPCDLKNLYLYKILYYRLLEMKGDVREIKYYFNKMSKLLLKTKYIDDKIECLFFYTIIDKKYDIALKIEEKLGDTIYNKTIFNIKRAFLTKAKLHGIDDSSIKKDYKIKDSIVGRIILEEFIISNYFE